MRFIRPTILVMAWIAAGCGGAGPAGALVEPGAEGAGGSTSRGAGGAGTGGHGGTPKTADGGSGATADANVGATEDAGTGGTAGTDEADSGSATTEDASTGGTADTDGTTDGGSAIVDSNTPMSVDGAPPPSYDGEIPIYYGPAVGPVVQMDCPDDPTVGWTEYKDSFNVQHPYNLPANKRFSITGGIYNFWVFPNDFPHSPNAGGRNPRTEARYGGTADKATGNNFQSGMRMYSTDMLVEKNAFGSAIMQLHATDPAVPIGVLIMPSGDMVNNGTLTVVKGSTVPGGLIDRCFNYKASLDTATMQVKIYINNCLKSTYTGQRGSGAFYFKNGVYFCKTSQNGCFSHYKNIHLYKK